MSFFDEIFSTALAYTSQPYSEGIVMRPAVTYTFCVTSSKEQTGNIITFAQFEEGNILTKIRNNAEINDDDSIIPPLMSKEDMYAMDYGDESDHDLISSKILEDIREKSQSHPNVNQIDARYKIRDRIR